MSHLFSGVLPWVLYTSQALETPLLLLAALIKTLKKTLHQRNERRKKSSPREREHRQQGKNERACR
jgi:hypothetical protein